ncbi:MAG TPA: hypothetical protein VNZ27_14520 [Rhodanobacter sp.]|jgi:hypothetical protein|nr:hypothetical protein [Rhodanobacter sp.]
MITTQTMIKSAKDVGLLHSMAYSYPLLIVNLVSHAFEEDDYEQNVEIISQKIGVSLDDVLDATSRSIISVRCFKSASDVPPTESSADHWMALFLGTPLANQSLADSPNAIRSIHFYGYKGGQARSTTLAMTAKRLADQGRSILVIDADIEAPSLHILFDTAIPRLSGSLMGACDLQTELNPINAYSAVNDGRIDMFGCHPSGEDYDLDFQAFALSATLDPSLLKRGFKRIRELAESSGRWDFVFIDHRTGIAPSVVPILSAYPGSAVINLRPDLLSTPAAKVAKVMLEAYPAYPGAFVSFSLDPEDRREPSTRELQLKEIFLGVLARAVELSTNAEEAIDPLSLEHNYINWYFDRAFIDQQTPDYDRLSKDNQNSISDLIQILGLDQRDEVQVTSAHSSSDAAPRVPSGASDTGWFIETREIAKLMQASSAFSYILGRKGTGKTRIYREMHLRNNGVPLLSAADYLLGGLRAQSIAAQSMLGQAQNFEQFWWRLVELALESTVLAPGEDLSEIVLNNKLFTPQFEPGRIYSIAKSLNKPVTLLIDGVETAVGSRDTRSFVEALFRVLSTIQNDASINEKIQFKLFIRPDLSVGIQNVEQQIAGRKLELRWDEASIFNYMLAEIGRKQWFNEQFPAPCGEIASNQTKIQEGQLERGLYEQILLGIFPIKIRRNNLLTMTFFRTYFSDAVSDTSDKRSSFYPRVVGSFLDHVERICRSEPDKALDSGGRVSHSILVDAFALATDEFVSEIKQELYFALELSSDGTSNQRLVDELIASLSGLQTPFFVDTCIEKLQTKLGESQVSDRVLRDALRQMKEMGIFETHPVDSNKWRAGRLFKEALRMKYVR